MEFLPALSALRGVVRSALEQTDLSATSMKGMVSLLESRLGCAEGAIYADKDARRHCKAIINDLIPEVQAEQAAAAARGGQKRWQSASSASESGESDGWGEAAESEDDFAHTGPKGRKRAKDDAGGGRRRRRRKGGRRRRARRRRLLSLLQLLRLPQTCSPRTRLVAAARARARAHARTHTRTRARARLLAHRGVLGAGVACVGREGRATRSRATLAALARTSAHVRPRRARALPRRRLG